MLHRSPGIQTVFYIPNTIYLFGTDPPKKGKDYQSLKYHELYRKYQFQSKWFQECKSQSWRFLSLSYCSVSQGRKCCSFSGTKQSSKFCLPATEYFEAEVRPEVSNNSAVSLCTLNSVWRLNKVISAAAVCYTSVQIMSLPTLKGPTGRIQLQKEFHCCLTSIEIQHILGWFPYLSF